MVIYMCSTVTVSAGDLCCAESGRVARQDILGVSKIVRESFH